MKIDNGTFLLIALESCKPIIVENYSSEEFLYLFRQAGNSKEFHAYFGTKSVQIRVREKTRRLHLSGRCRVRTSVSRDEERRL